MPLCQSPQATYRTWTLENATVAILECAISWGVVVPTSSVTPRNDLNESCPNHIPCQLKGGPGPQRIEATRHDRQWQEMFICESCCFAGSASRRRWGGCWRRWKPSKWKTRSWKTYLSSATRRSSRWVMTWWQSSSRRNRPLRRNAHRGRPRTCPRRSGRASRSTDASLHGRAPTGSSGMCRAARAAHSRGLNSGSRRAATARHGVSQHAACRCQMGMQQRLHRVWRAPSAAPGRHRSAGRFRCPHARASVWKACPYHPATSRPLRPCSAACRHLASWLTPSLSSSVVRTVILSVCRLFPLNHCRWRGSRCPALLGSSMGSRSRGEHFRAPRWGARQWKLSGGLSRPGSCCSRKLARTPCLASTCRHMSTAGPCMPHPASQKRWRLLTLPPWTKWTLSNSGVVSIEYWRVAQRLLVLRCH